MQRSLLLRRLPAWMRRTLAGRLLGLLLSTAALLAQETAIRSAPDTKTTAEVRVFASAREAAPTVTERGAHHRVEQWVERIIGEDGATNDVTHSYTVLANGMNYLDGGEWKETVAEFVPVKGGWLAGRGPHQVLVSDDLFVAGAVTVVSPEGATWKSTPMTLAMRDRAKGEVLVLGESRATRGEQVAANVILFRDAFDGPVPADVRVIYTAAGIECDVILRSRLPLSATLGADPAQCDLVVQTEVFEGGPTALRERQRTVNKPADGQPEAAQKVPESRADAVLELGALRMEDGKAFGTDADPAAEPGQSVPVYKHFYRDEATQRLFLEESTPLDSLESLLEPLPEASLPGAWEARWRDTALNETSTRKSGVAGVLRPAPALPRRDDGRFEVAAAPQSGTLDVELASAARSTASPYQSFSSPGVVLDWSYLNSAGAFTLTAGSTYSITGAVTLGGSDLVVTVEPGVVIKYAPGGTASLSILTGTDLRWLAEHYLPVILTARDDNTVGETVAASTGNPNGNPGGPYYAATALRLNSPPPPPPGQPEVPSPSVQNLLVISNLFVRYAALAVRAENFNQLQLRNVQVTTCAAAWTFQGGNEYTARNALLVNVGTLFKDCSAPKRNVSFSTLDGIATLDSNPAPGIDAPKFSKSVLFNVAGASGGLGASNWIEASPNPSPFTTAGAGSHYIDQGSPAYLQTPGFGFFGDGRDDPSNFTLRPPPLLGNLGPQPVRLAPLPLPPGPDPTGHFPGYRYYKLDHIANGVTVSGPISLTNGVALGLSGATALQLAPGAVFGSFGTPIKPNRLVRLNLVQEGTAGLTGLSFSVFGLGTLGWPRPAVSARFTEFLLPGGPGRTLFYDISNSLGSLALRDSRLVKRSIYLLPPATAERLEVTLRNNIFEAADLGFHHYHDSNFAVALTNNLFRNGICLIYYRSQAYDTQTPAWTIKDNLFVGNLHQLTTVGWGAYSIQASHNGYTGTTATFGGAGNVTERITDFETGPLGRYYYPKQPPPAGVKSLYGLIDAGSVGAQGPPPPPSNPNGPSPGPFHGLYHGLYHYTTRTWAADPTGAEAGTIQPEPREPAGRVDIGFHYVGMSRDIQNDQANPAVNWVALSDSEFLPPKDRCSLNEPSFDGIPDYLEDVDGDGQPRWDFSKKILIPDPDSVESVWNLTNPGCDRLNDFVIRFTGLPVNALGAADADSDGQINEDEYHAGTNPLTTVEEPQGAGPDESRLLQEWLFEVEGSAPPQGTDLSVQGVGKIAGSATLYADSYDGKAAYFPATTATSLRYPLATTSGSVTRRNLRLLHGEVRMTYVPDWTVASPPNDWCRLLECGSWGLSLTPDGKCLVFTSPGAPGVRTNAVVSVAGLGRPSASAPQVAWNIRLGYTRVGVWIWVNDTLLNAVYSPIAGMGDADGVATLPAATEFVVGSSVLNAAYRYPARGYIDRLETYSAVSFLPHNPSEKNLLGVVSNPVDRRNQVASATPNPNGNGILLKWFRGWDGDPAQPASAASYQVDRRTLGATTWPSAPLTTSPVFNHYYADTTAAAGVYYEYRIRNGNTDTSRWPVIAAARDGAPIADRGQAILIVEEGLRQRSLPSEPNWPAPNVGAAIDAYKADLVAEGWQVVEHQVKRMPDYATWATDTAANGYPTADFTYSADWAASGSSANTEWKARVADVKAKIQQSWTANQGGMNVAILIGHVPVPYSGFGAEDGHNSNNSNSGPFHDGAWPADAYYGDMTGTALDWGDTASGGCTAGCDSNTASHLYNAVGDGKFDRNRLPNEPGGAPGRLEVAVGRIDFGRLPAYRGATVPLPDSTAPASVRDTDEEAEAWLYLRYFSKVAAFRRGSLNFTDGWTSFVQDSVSFSEILDSTRNLVSRVYGTEPLIPSLLSNDAFKQPGVSLWGLHGGFGTAGSIQGEKSKNHIGDGIVFGSPEDDVPDSAFLALRGSYLGDWNVDNAYIRVCATTPGRVLATWWAGRPFVVEGGAGPYQFDPLALGRPLAALQLATFDRRQDQSVRTSYLLGDPTLRTHYAKPPTAIGIGAVTPVSGGYRVVVNWANSNNPSGLDGYAVFRRTNDPLLPLAPWAMVGTVGSSVLTFTDEPVAAGAYAYQVRGLITKATGAGSYRNQTLGVSINRTVP